MSVPTPHYLLFSEVHCEGPAGRWRFRLQTPDGSDRFEAADVEPGLKGDRLNLLTVVRGLEALNQPSQVTLIGCSSYVRNGMQYGLSEWRSNGWRWECFGQMVPVKNGDLWQRMDRALRFHQVECRRRIDPAHGAPSMPTADAKVGQSEKKAEDAAIRVAARRWIEYRLSAAATGCFRWMATTLRRWRRPTIGA
jgi:ribonuclease HI